MSPLEQSRRDCDEEKFDKFENIKKSQTKLDLSLFDRVDCCKVDEPGQVPHIGGLSHFGTVIDDK